MRKPLLQTWTAGKPPLLQMPSLPSSSCDIVRIAIVPPFSALRRFEQGRNFKQWTSEDTKALMKVRVRFWFTPESRASCRLQVNFPAIEGYVPPDMLRCLQAILGFCSVVRHDVITEIDFEALRKSSSVSTATERPFWTKGLRRVVLTLPARDASLHADDTAVWSSKRSLFFHRGIQTYEGREGAVATYKPL